MKYRRSVAGSAFLFALSAASGASAVGMGNVTFTQQELNTPVAMFDADLFTTGPSGSNTAVMLRDVMVMLGSYDSGKPPGAIHIFDVKNPKAPRRLATLNNTPETNALREQHAMPVAVIDGKDIMAMPTLTGISFWDFTAPLAPKPIGSLNLAGVNGGDYDNAAWQIAWSWPYAYVGGTGSGVYVVDARDPTKPTLVRRILLSELGNFRIGPVYAAGNYILVGGMDQGPTKISVLDVSSPMQPMLVATGAAPTEMYSMVVIGDQIYGAGASGKYAFLKWTPTAVTNVAARTYGSDKGGYCSYQDSFIFCGQSTEGYRKIDVRMPAAPVQALAGDIPNDSGADTDFATVFGNVVLLGNDHGTGSAFFPHTTAPDTTPPKLVKAYPSDQEVKQPLSTRITLFFSDQIDIASMTPANIIVRKVGGAAIDGVFSYSSLNAVSFGPKLPLDADSTYEVVVPAAGLADIVGNKIVEPVQVRFSTGATIAGGPSTGGQGGAGGAAGSGAGGAATAGGGGAAGAVSTAGAGGSGTSTAGAAGSGTAGASAGGAAGAPTATGGSTAAGGTGSSAAGSSAGGPPSIPTTGGSPGAGGSAGAPPASAGTSSGAAASGSGGPGGSGESSGCAVSVPSGVGSAGFASFLAAALLMVARRARGRGRSTKG
ncbi:MAG TPA: Ig-like domain-containing protein [Polyangiaceae bacterium]|nr:Ig-like domain-containing protein [Polyangiaceae bacterium]